MIACTWPLGTARLIPYRISLSSSANFTRRFLISSMLTPSPLRAGLLRPRRSTLPRVLRSAHLRRAHLLGAHLFRARAQLDLGWIEHAHPIAFPLRGLAVLDELDEERLAGAEGFDHGADL